MVIYLLYFTVYFVLTIFILLLCILYPIRNVLLNDILIISKEKHIEQLTGPKIYTQTINTTINPGIFSRQMIFNQHEVQYMTKSDLTFAIKRDLINGILEKDINDDVIKVDIQYNRDGSTELNAKCVFLNVKEYFNEVNDLKNK